jgi:hypothetical protein
VPRPIPSLRLPPVNAGAPSERFRLPRRISGNEGGVGVVLNEDVGVHVASTGGAVEGVGWWIGFPKTL